MVAVQNYHGNPAPPGKPVLTFQTGDVIELLRGDPESQWWEVGPGPGRWVPAPPDPLQGRGQRPAPPAGPLVEGSGCSLGSLEHLLLPGRECSVPRYVPPQSPPAHPPQVGPGPPESGGLAETRC